MIDKVIICGLRRANKLVPEIEVRQMMGRSGRSYDASRSGKVIILTKKQDEDIAEKYLHGELPSIESSMSEVNDMAFHVLPSIYSKEVYDDVSAYEWYRRTLASMQGKKFDYDELIDYLKLHEMIEEKDNRFEITELGKLSCKFYFSPEKVFIWKTKFENLVKRDLLNDDACLAWALATNEISTFVDYELQDMFYGECSAKRLSFDFDEKMDGLAYYCLLKGYNPKELKFTMIEYKEDIERITNLLLRLNGIFEWHSEEYIDILRIRIKRKVDFEYAKFMLQSKIYNKSIITQLFDWGIRTKEELEEKMDMLESYCDKGMFDKIKQALNG